MSEKRDNIIKAASELIHLKGFNNTSVEDILQRSGTKKGNFYFYFRSKEELGFVVLENHLEKFRSCCMAPILDSDDQPLNKLMRILDALEMEQSQANCQGGCPFGNLALELSDTHDGFRTRLQEIFQGIADVFHRLLQEASTGFRPGPNLSEVSQFIVAAVEGGIMLAKVHKSVVPLQQCVRHLKNYLSAFQLGPAAVGEAYGAWERGTPQ